MSEIGERVSKLRKQRGISQEDLAEVAGVHQTMISAIERGTRLPSIEVLKALQDFFGVALLDVQPTQEPAHA